jgi:hypothetical protein
MSKHQRISRRSQQLMDMEAHHLSRQTELSKRAEMVNKASVVLNSVHRNKQITDEQYDILYRAISGEIDYIARELRA